MEQVHACIAEMIEQCTLLVEKGGKSIKTTLGG
jgi:hypothetical protein